MRTRAQVVTIAGLLVSVTCVVILHVLRTVYRLPSIGSASTRTDPTAG